MQSLKKIHAWAQMKVPLLALYSRKLTSILVSSFFFKKLLLCLGFPSTLINVLKYSVRQPEHCLQFKCLEFHSY